MSATKAPTLRNLFPLWLEEYGLEPVMDGLARELEQRSKLASGKNYTLASRRYMQAQQLVDLAKLSTAIAVEAPAATPQVPDASRSYFSHGMRPKAVARLFERSPGAWNDGWWAMNEVRDGFIYAMGMAAKDVPPPPDWTCQRGIVIAAGGWKYFPSLYVTAKIIRKHKCTLPIEVWYFGDNNELHPKMVQLLKGCDVTFVDANAFWREHPETRQRWPMINHGWWLKSYMLAWCRFKEAILFDSDAYPTRDPETLLEEPPFKEFPAFFWPDINDFKPEQWKHFGLDPNPGKAFESGQIVVDKGRCWPAVWHAAWMNARWDYVYKHVWGDKDTFLLSFEATETPYVLPQPNCDYHGSCILQKDFQGDVWTVHRTQDKFRLEADHEGLKIDNKYYGPMTGKAPIFDRYLPLEWQAHEFFKELQKKMAAK